MDFESDPREKRDAEYALSDLEFMDRSLERLADELVEKYAEISNAVTGILFKAELTKEDDARLKAFEEDLKVLDARWKRDIHAFDKNCTAYEKQYGHLEKIKELLDRFYDRIEEQDEMSRRGLELVHLPHKRRKAVRQVNGEANPIEALENKAIQGALQARVEAELQMLTQLEHIFDEINHLIPKLPPEQGEPFGPEERAVQTMVWERFAEARKLVYLYTFEHTNPDGKEKELDTVFELGTGRMAGLGVLKDRGVITEKEWGEWIMQSSERFERLTEFIVRTFDLQQEHMERLMRKK